MRYCTRKEYCSNEILEKLISWGCSDKESQSILIFLKNHQYVDDQRYVNAYANDKLQINKWGKVKITYMLRMQKIEESIISDAISAIDPQQYEQILKDELNKKRKTIKSKNIFETKAKLYRFAASRGFESDLINRSISRI